AGTLLDLGRRGTPACRCTAAFPRPNALRPDSVVGRWAILGEFSNGPCRNRAGIVADRDARTGRRAEPGPAAQPTQARALRKMRIQGESSPSPGGAQLICTVRNTRSGCGIRIVA